jgi:gp32 DNA binding protein like
MSKFSLDFSKLLTQIDSVSSSKKTYEKDENFWKPTKDKSGNAAAVIRFLPSKNIDDFPFVRLYKHNFKDAETGRWYIENSLTTIGGQDLVSTINKELWNTGIKENKDLASLRKRKLSYVANILVIKDLGNPENNGKVFKYSFGMKIWDKITGAAKPEEALGEEPISAFCPINGADFLLKMTLNKDTDQYNYDSSKFNAKKAMFDGDDDKIEEVLNQCFDIQLEIAPDKFKTEAELSDKFLWVTGQKVNTTGKVVDKAKQDQFDADDAEMDALTKMAAEPAKVAKEPVKARKAPPMPVESSDGDDEAFFKSLISD